MNKSPDLRDVRDASLRHAPTRAGQPAARRTAISASRGQPATSAPIIHVLPPVSMCRTLLTSKPCFSNLVQTCHAARVNLPPDCPSPSAISIPRKHAAHVPTLATIAACRDSAVQHNVCRPNTPLPLGSRPLSHSSVCRRLLQAMATSSGTCIATSSLTIAPDAGPCCATVLAYASSLFARSASTAPVACSYLYFSDALRYLALIACARSSLKRIVADFGGGAGLVKSIGSTAKRTCVMRLALISRGVSDGLSESRASIWARTHRKRIMRKMQTVQQTHRATRTKMRMSHHRLLLRPSVFASSMIS